MGCFTLYLKEGYGIKEIIKVSPEAGTTFIKSLKECVSNFKREYLYYSVTGDVRDSVEVDSFDKVLKDYYDWMLKFTER